MNTTTLKKVLDLIDRATTIIRNLDDYNDHGVLLRELEAARRELTREFQWRVDSLPLIDAVCRELSAVSYRKASLAYPGFIGLTYGPVEGPLAWAIGNTNNFWAGDITTETGEAKHGFTLDAESAFWTDPKQIASAIWDAVLKTEVERAQSARAESDAYVRRTGGGGSI